MIDGVLQCMRNGNSGTLIGRMNVDYVFDIFRQYLMRCNMRYLIEYSGYFSCLDVVHEELEQESIIIDQCDF